VLKRDGLPAYGRRQIDSRRFVKRKDGAAEKEDRKMYWNFGWGWGMGVGCVATLLLWILIILGIVFLVKTILRAEKKGAAGETALDILKKRYAGGEISKEEFEEKKKDIQ
jgi:putative membrane protein